MTTLQPQACWWKEAVSQPHMSRKRAERRTQGLNSTMLLLWQCAHAGGWPGMQGAGHVPAPEHLSCADDAGCVPWAPYVCI